jgi:rod shape-determining protein MreC
MAAPRTARSRSVLYVIVLSAITLLAAQRLVNPLRGRVQDTMSRIDSLGARAAKPATKQIKKRLSYDALLKENERLVSELDKAKASSLRFDDAVRERKELLELNGFEDPDGYKSVQARIVGMALNNVDQTVRIDRGTTNGVREDMTVISAAGLIGRVVDASANNATVMLITDPEMSVGVRFSRTGEVAVSRGQNTGAPLRLELVSLSTKVSRGDRIVTSGLENSRFPPGIPVGIVQSVRSGSVSQEVTVRPAVDLDRIRFVRVLFRTEAP